MIQKEMKIGLIVKIFTFVLIVLVASKIVINYYNKAADKKDRLEAKQIQKTISLVVAKYIGNDLTYKNGRIFWTRKNAEIIRNGIIENLFVENKEIPNPKEKGYYYYMYLDSPYTVIKLPYRLENLAYVKAEDITQDYISQKYPKDEYPQVNDQVPYVQTEYEEEYYYYDPSFSNSNNGKNVIVCLNK